VSSQSPRDKGGSKILVESSNTVECDFNNKILKGGSKTPTHHNPMGFESVESKSLSTPLRLLN